MTTTQDTTSVATRFELLSEQEIPEINAYGRLYRHRQTGAQVLSLTTDDENKVFGITFRTPPRDSTGIAHILEHSVLCGSRKYPVREPFVEMLKGSLKTFLNAFTYPDKTCYPVASQNTQDFYNLIDVYLDAVFYPRITRHIFEQEGWHYELEDPDAPLIYKGVVFNEMKGAYSSPDRMLMEAAQHSLFPDTTYGVSSGGHPRHIPDLTYEQFKHFHETHYHPSNARIYFYGDDDPDTRLRIIDGYLSEFQPLDVDSQVTLQAHFDAPRHSTATFPVNQDDPESRKARMTVNWLLPETTRPFEALAFNILSHILMGTPAAPLRKALLDSGLGEDITGGGYIDHPLQGYFSVGLKGIDPANADNVEQLILSTLEQLAKEGISREAIAASINTIEFRLRENNTGSFPRGLFAMLNALGTWLHDGDPFAMLAFEKPLNGIKTQIAEGKPLFENLLRAHFLDNTHRTTTVLNPDPQQAQREREAEEARLAAVRASLSPADVDAIIENTRQLKDMQTAPDDPAELAKIPMLTLADIDRQHKTIPCEESRQQDTRLLYHELPTNGITYLDLALDLHTLPQALLPYVPLFARALLEMGTQSEDYVKLLQRIGRKTGGISATRFASALPNSDTSTVWLIVRGKATQGQNRDLLAILRDILLTVQLDDQARFRQIVTEEKARLESGLVTAGHMFASLRLASCFNESDWSEEQTRGISYYFFVRDLLKTIENDWPTVLASLQQIHQTLINRNALLANVTLDSDNWQGFAPQLDDFLAHMPIAPLTPASWTPQYGSGFEGLVIPSQVNYVGKAANLLTLGHTPTGATTVITKYLRTTWLWERIRMQGGAYGAFSMFDRHSGVFEFLSYRDPNLLNTLDVYDQTSQFLRETALNQTEVERAIIGTIGALDAYQLPDAKGYTSLIYSLIGESDEQRQQHRDEVLATTASDFRAFASVLEQVKTHGLIAVAGSAEAIEAANRERGDFLKRIDVL